MSAAIVCQARHFCGVPSDVSPKRRFASDWLRRDLGLTHGWDWVDIALSKDTMPGVAAEELKDHARQRIHNDDLENDIKNVLLAKRHYGSNSRRLML